MGSPLEFHGPGQGGQLLGPDGRPIVAPAPIIVPDDTLVSCLVEWGQPRQSAEQLRRNDGLRRAATMFYFDTIEAAKGDRAAKARVERCRGVWADMEARERGESRGPSM